MVSQKTARVTVTLKKFDIQFSNVQSYQIKRIRIETTTTDLKKLMTASTQDGHVSMDRTKMSDIKGKFLKGPHSADGVLLKWISVGILPTRSTGV